MRVDNCAAVRNLSVDRRMHRSLAARHPLISVDQCVDIEPDSNGVLSQQQIAMRASEDKNLRTVVRYNAETGARSFDVINAQTGQSVPGVERPDAFLLQDTTLDIQNKIAKNRNIGTNWELVIEGNTALDEY